MVDTLKEKKGEKVFEQDEDTPNIRIILKSQEVKNLDYVSNKILELAKEKGFNFSGPRYMPNKTLVINTRKGPCGNGTATFDRLELRIHTRVIDVKCKPNNVAAITDFKIKPGVDINIKIW
jgi:small subunit ribosomal protein S20e